VRRVPQGLKCSLVDPILDPIPPSRSADGQDPRSNRACGFSAHGLRKSATASASERPKAAEHYESMAVERTLEAAPAHIAVVDDVVTLRIPAQAEHRFRAKVNTCSGMVNTDSGHGERSFRAR
jgi:hypothetical protein